MKRSRAKVKEKKPEKENFDFMKTNKDNIRNVLKDEALLPIINDLVFRTNKIVIHAYQFLKLHCIHLYETNQDFPEINKGFICDIFKVITIRKSNLGAYTEKNMPSQLRTLSIFYQEHYSKTVANNKTIYYDKLPYILAYEAIDMITNINYNIQENYISHLNKYVNIVFDIKTKQSEITKTNKDKDVRKKLHKKLYEEIGKVKYDILNLGEMCSDPQYHSWVKEHRNKLYPNKTAFENNSIYYELKSNTQYFLCSMFHICTTLEKINGQKILDEKNQIRLFNVLPLRTNIIPKHICIDTCGLIQNLIGDEYNYRLLSTYKKENKYNALWSKCFKINNRVFKKGRQYTFNFMIKTDGVSCSVLFIKTDEFGIPLSKTLENKKCCQEENIDYIENTLITKELQNMKVVCADPNMSDLIYCGSKDADGTLETFRYTQNQRRLETRTKKYSKIIDTVNKDTIINDQTIKGIETELSVLNSKSCDYDKFKLYCIGKNKMNGKLNDHYQQFFFRKFKLNAFTNMKKSEHKMVKNFKKKFGTPDETIYVMGDYDKGSCHMKGKEPTICKKFRRIFRNAGYKTFLVNEFRTSKLCNGCHNDLEMFMKRPTNKPKRKGEKEMCHGLLRCQSVKQCCEVIHNRDKNAVQNMLNIVDSVINAGNRPEAFCRSIL